MNHSFKSTLKVAVAVFLLATPCVDGAVHAEDADGAAILTPKDKEAAEAANPLRFYKGANGSYLQATFQADVAFFSQNNNSFGNDIGFIGGVSNSWGESLVRPGLEGSYTFTKYQKFYGRIDAVQANTFNGIDATGTNLAYGESVNDLRIGNSYAGWRSGMVFDSLGEDFLDISFGRQQYIAGSGFLFHTEGQSGYNRAAWYLGGRRLADYAGIVRMKSGGWSGDLFYLEFDDIAKTNTRAGGTTMNYAFEKLSSSIGGGYYFLTSDNPARDDMKVYDIRGSIKPFEASEKMAFLKPLKFDAEYAYENKNEGYGEGNGWYVAASYQFEQVAWKPELTYRYASFDQDFDPLFYGFSDWGTWFQGEILGEYVLSNSNLLSNMIKLKFQPIDPVTVNLIYYHFTIDDPAAFGVTSDDYADEYNVAIDWAANDHLTLSLVGGYAVPGDAATQQTGGDNNWSYMMMMGTVKF